MIRSSWWPARRSISKFRRMPKSFSKAMSNLGEMRTEGPFGDHTGFYSLEGQYPVFHVDCITHRKDPLYLTTIVGPPPQEDYFIGHVIERVFLAGDEDAASGNCGCGHAGRRNFSESDDRVDSQELSRACA